MRKSEAVKMPEVSPCHAVQGEIELEGIEFLPSLFDGKLNHSSTEEIFKEFKNIVESNNNDRSMELEEGELIEGIEANDVSTLLEQFLEYEEKQGVVKGSLDFSSSSVGLLTSAKDTSHPPEEDSIAHKILSFTEAHDLDFVFPLETANGAADSLDVKVSENLSSLLNGDSLVVNDIMEKHDKNCKIDKKDHVDNHATDHNYACSGFPLRKTPVVKPEVISHPARRNSISSPRKSEASDLKHENENKLSNGTEVYHSTKRQSSCDKDCADKKSRIPKRYRGPYCEDSSSEDSSCDEDNHYSKRKSGGHAERSDYRRKQRKRKGSYSSDEESYYKESKRRRSLYSSNSSDERVYSDSDEDNENERRCRYDPRRPESNTLRYGHSNHSDRDSGRWNTGRKGRSQSKDRSEKDRSDKKFYDIELERKMGFKFDQNIKGTAKEERRIVYVGKISNKTTEDDVWRRFRPFGPIEKVTVHFRDKGDNYAFVTFFEYSSAAEAIERGNENPSLPKLDICFGGRRKFCGGSYVDFDSNASYLEEREASRPPSSDEMDFDTLLQLSQKVLKSKKESRTGR